MHVALRSPVLLTLSITLLAGTVAAQQPNNRAVLNRRPAANVQVNPAAIANAAVYGPNVIDVDRAMATAGARIQPDWEIAKAPNLGAAIRYLEPQQKQGFMSANGISPMGGGGFADIAQAYNGPAGSVGVWAQCAASSGRRLDGKMFASLYKGSCATGMPGLEIDYQPSKASGGALLDCAFKSDTVTALRAVVKGREGNAFTVLLGETTQSFPKGAAASMPIAIKKSPGSDAPVMVKINIAENSADGFIDLYGCTVTPLS